MTRTAIVGGGAAGFFCAINLARMCPQTSITIYEQQQRVLSKVEISGGGRCNCTNSFEGITDLRQVYPRGATLLKRLFKTFGPRDAYEWFESHGIPLVTQDDNCVFPQAQDSHAIIDCFMREARQAGIRIKTNHKISNINELTDEYDFVVVTTGGITKPQQASFLHPEPSVLTPCVPSLFTFNINDKALHQRMGIVVENATASIPATKFKSEGALLITHWGMSGPAILKLSSHAALYLAERQYQSPLSINWTGISNTEQVRTHLTQSITSNSRLIDNLHPFNLQSSLWQYLLTKAGMNGRKCQDIGPRNINKLTELLTNDLYHINGRSHYKDEFVTCGGISTSSINPNTLESKHHPNLFFAGEVLDIDGITGGFNFQAAWTTGYVVAQSISKSMAGNRPNLL